MGSSIPTSTITRPAKDASLVRGGGPSPEERSLAPKAEESRRLALRHTASRLTRSVRTASKAIRGNCRRARRDAARNEAARKRNGHTCGAQDELRQMNGESDQK